MRTRTPLALALALAATAFPARSQNPFADYIRAHYPALAKCDVHRFLADARADGLITSDADQRLAKRAYGAFFGRHKGPKGNARNLPVAPTQGLPLASSPLAAIAEIEHNDTDGWPDGAVGQTTINGALGSATDADVFRILVPGDSILTVVVAAGASGGITDPDLTITDADGRLVAYDDDQSTSNRFPRIGIQLPSGFYSLRIGSAVGSMGSYVVTYGTAPILVPLIPPGVSVNAGLPVGSDLLYRLVLGADSRIDLTVSGGVLDMNLTVRTPTGARYRFVDDNSTSLDPGFTSYLPAGVWYVSFGEFNNATGTFSFKAVVTTTTIPSAPCASSITGTIRGNEDLDLFKLVLATSARVRFQTFPNGTPPMTDTVLRLWDAKLGQITNNDEQTNSSFSLLDTPLPAGTYFLTNEGYYGDSGGYSLNATCGLAFTPGTAPFGRSVGSIAAAGESALYVIKLRTPNPFELRVDMTSGTNQGIPVMSIVDKGGLVRAYHDDWDYLSLGDHTIGADLPEGEYWILVRDWFVGSGTFDLHLMPPMFFADTATNRTLTNIDKAGLSVYGFVALNPLAVGVQMPAPIVGKLLIDLSMHVSLNSLVVPAAGRVTWPINFNPYTGIVLQGVSVNLSPLSLQMSDIVK